LAAPNKTYLLVRCAPTLPYS